MQPTQAIEVTRYAVIQSEPYRVLPDNTIEITVGFYFSIEDAQENSINKAHNVEIYNLPVQGSEGINVQQYINEIAGLQCGSICDI